MKKENRAKFLFKNTMIFTLGNFATKFISFFLVPLYTNILSTSEYGIVDLVFTICTIAVPIITLNVMESVMRFNLDKEVENNKITKIGIVVLFCGAIIGLLLIPLCNLWDKVSSYSILIYFYVICSAASQIFLCDLRGKEQLVFYTIGNVLNTILIAIFNILFLLVFKWGILGYLLAYTLASGIVAVYALFIGKGYKAIGTTIDKKKMKEMLKYSIILIPNSFMWWIMNSSDHIMVTSMVGVAANGIYAISYKLPTLISTITQIFNQAWSYSAIREEGASDEEEYNNKILKSMIGVVMIIDVGMMVVIKPFFKFYVSPNYYEAWKYTPFLIIGCVYLTMGTFMATSYTVHKDSFGYLFSGMFGAIFNIALNFVLIPMIGVYGAAIATCISYILVFVFRLFHTRKYIRYDIKNKGFMAGSTILVLSAFFMFIDSWYGMVLQCILFIFAICLFSDVWFPILKKMLKFKGR